MNAMIAEVMAQATEARNRLALDPLVGQYVDATLPMPRPFLGSGEIRLIVIGQDPTVQSPVRRQSISTVLTLNERKRPLRRFLIELCKGLNLLLDEHVYATNAAKNFFVHPPTKLIKEIDVIAASRDYWLPVLRNELAYFPNAAIISLGQPVLSMLVRAGHSRLMRHYWGYHRDWKAGRRVPFLRIEAGMGEVDRPIYPFVHQPSLHRSYGKEYYSARMAEYIAFIKENISWE